LAVAIGEQGCLDSSVWILGRVPDSPFKDAQVVFSALTVPVHFFSDNQGLESSAVWSWTGTLKKKKMVF